MMSVYGHQLLLGCHEYGLGYAPQFDSVPVHHRLFDVGAGG